MTAAANSDARKRLAEQQAAPVSFANRQSDTLRDILHALFYSKNTVNWPGSLAEEVAALVAEHYGALADEWERTAAECARLANGPRAGLSDEEPLRTAALVNSKRAADLRAALGGDAS